MFISNEQEKMNLAPIVFESSGVLLRIAMFAI